jgi:hypothetical protein
MKLVKLVNFFKMLIKEALTQITRYRHYMTENLTRRITYRLIKTIALRTNLHFPKLDSRSF